MAAFEKFHYQTLEQLKAEIAALGLELPLSEDLSPLAQSVRVGNRVAPNSIAVCRWRAATARWMARPATW